jgi:hypothetical protein
MLQHAQQLQQQRQLPYTAAALPTSSSTSTAAITTSSSSSNGTVSIVNSDLPPPLPKQLPSMASVASAVLKVRAIANPTVLLRRAYTTQLFVCTSKVSYCFALVQLTAQHWRVRRTVVYPSTHAH